MLRSLFNSWFKRIALPPRHRKSRSYRPELLGLESRTLLSTISWLRPVDGDWANAANWAGGRVPGPSDDAVIPFAGITVTHAGGTDTVVSLTSEANLDISAGSLQLRGGTAFDGGDKPSRIDGLLSVRAAGSLTVGDSHGDFGVVLGGTGSVQNFGALNLNVLSTLAVPVDNAAGVLNDKGSITQTFSNGPGAHLHFAGDAAFFGNANLPVIANGFTNQGQIDFVGDVFQDQQIALVVPNGTVVNAPGGTIDFNADGSIVGSVDNQGTITVEGLGGLGTSGATVSNEGTITVTPSVRLQGNLGISDATFTNTGTITVNSVSAFDTIVSQSSFTNTGSITVNGTFSQLVVSGGTFTQAGTLSVTNLLSLNGVTATLTPEAIAGAGAVSIQGSTITSSGLLTSVSSIGNSSTVNADIVNTRGGINSLSIGGHSTLNGSVTNAPGARLDITGSVTLNGNVTNAPGAILDLQGSLALAQSFTNDGTITVGVIGNPDWWEVTTPGFLTANQDLTNNGTVVLVDGDIAVPNGTFTNAPGGTINIGDGVSDNGTAIDTLHAALVNQGTLAVKQTVGLTGTVTNSGTVNVQTGDLNLMPPASDFQGASFVNAGTLTVRSVRAVFISGGADFANDGAVSLTDFGSVVVTGSYTQSDGKTQLANGLLTVNGLVDLEGGVLAGTGVINGNVLNNAEMDVGQPGSPGILTIVGDYTQTAGGNLVVEIGGVHAGTDFDQLKITGQATLDGTLTVNLIKGFQPTSGTGFTVLTFGAESGAFATLDGDGPLFNPSVDPTDMTLVAS
jgi:hypothetical protein